MTHLGFDLFVVAFALLLMRRLAQATPTQSKVIDLEAAEAQYSTVASVGSEQQGDEIAQQNSLRTLRFWAQLVITLAILGAALFIILSQRFPVDQQKWACSAVGTVLGFWLKG